MITLTPCSLIEAFTLLSNGHIVKSGFLYYRVWEGTLICCNTLTEYTLSRPRECWVDALSFPTTGVFEWADL